MKFYLTLCVFLFQTCFQMIDGSSLEKNVLKNKNVIENKDVYEMRYILWVVIGINVIGGIIFFAFGQSSDSKNKNEHPEEKMIKVSIKQIDSM